MESDSSGICKSLWEFSKGCKFLFYECHALPFWNMESVQNIPLLPQIIIYSNQFKNQPTNSCCDSSLYKVLDIEAILFYGSIRSPTSSESKYKSESNRYL